MDTAHTIASCLCRLSSALAVFLLLGAVQAHGQWNVEHFGTNQLAKPFDVRVGKARNDGTNRVYVSERNGRITEWCYASGNWSMTVVAPVVTNLALIAIGDVHNDGTNRLYYTEFKPLGDLHEVTWTGTGWHRTTIDQDRSSLNLFIGPGRNDGRNRLYVGGMSPTSPTNPYPGLWEYTWEAGTWQKQQLHGTAMEGRGTVGNLRNDGTNRVIANSSSLGEYAWNGSAYTGTSIDSSTNLWPDPVAVGTTHNDELTRIVVNSGHGKVEYTYSGGTWDKHVFDSTVQRGDIFVARLKADGHYRVYATHTVKTWSPTKPAGPVKEYSWNAAVSRYDSNTVVDAVTGATAMLDAGNGRNDGVARLYAPDYAGGEMLEITSTDPLVYATPRADLRIAGVEATADGVVLQLSNLTERCEYRVQRTPVIGQPWSNTASFTASAPLVTWSNSLESGATFYRAIGLPQQEP